MLRPFLCLSRLTYVLLSLASLVRSSPPVHLQNAPTATPAGYQSAAPLPSTPSPSLVAQQTTQTPTYIPRYSARRHSLREKVLIRSAIKKAITPPISPAVAPVAAQVQQPELGEGEVEMKDDFAAGEEEEEDEEEDEIVPIGVRVRPEDVPLPESPAVRLPASTFRSSTR